MIKENKIIYLLWGEGNTPNDRQIIGKYYSAFEAEEAIEHYKQHEKGNSKLFITRHFMIQDTPFY